MTASFKISQILCIMLLGLLTANQANASLDLLNHRKVYSYRNSSSSIFALDVYGAVPKNNSKLPALIFFHGGGWARGGKNQFSNQAINLTKKANLIIISADYPVNRNPVESTEAALAAVCWVKTNSEKLNIDESRIAVSGGSAGGQLALSVALVNTQPPPECKNVTQPYVNAIILFNPVLDLKGAWEKKLGLELSSVSPIDQLDQSLPPTLILQGTADKITPIAIARKFITKARETGTNNIKMIEYPGRPHGFYNNVKSGDFNSTLDDIILFLTNLGWIN